LANSNDTTVNIFGKSDYYKTDNDDIQAHNYNCDENMAAYNQSRHKSFFIFSHTVVVNTTVV